MSKITVFCLSQFVLIAVRARAADKVVVIPLNTSDTSNKIWGEGREGISATPAATVNGITIARSSGTASWDGAAAACPENTWVCSQAEVQGLNTGTPTPSVNYSWCDGTTNHTTRYSWVRDQSDAPNSGKAVAVDDPFDPGVYIVTTKTLGKCLYLPVWCCSSAHK